MGNKKIRLSEKQCQDTEKGLVCRGCGCRQFTVVYTRESWGNTVIRRRECRNCGKRILTKEKTV
ncbi:MAG: hypothetical protein JXD22_11655 [Sedimentisphaerales bacterium]|nr:hypothetical protein [Sedimentisphaerales bacterium]